MPPSPNPDVPRGATPGVYFRFNSRGQSGAAPDQRLAGRYRVNVFATMASDGDMSCAYKNTRVNGLADVITIAGRKSGCRRGIERVLAQVGSGLDLFITPIPMASGTKATYPLTVLGLGTATAATGNDQIILAIDDKYVVADVANGDTLATIAGNLKAQIDALSPSSGPGSSCPFTAGGLAGATIPLTWAINGIQGEDHPIASWVGPNLTGIGLSPGYVTFDDGGGNTGANSGTVTVRSRTKTVVASGIAANRTAAQVCQATVDAINADPTGFPCRAQVKNGDPKTMELIMKNGRPCDTFSVSVNTNIGPLTATMTADTAGSGTPTVSPALDLLGQADAQQEWITEFTDATTLSALATHVRTFGDGYNQKEQFLSWGSTLGLAAAGAVVSTVSPSLITEDDLKASPGRFQAGWCPNAFQTGFELACHRSAARAVQQRPTKNFNGLPLITQSPQVNLTYPDSADRPDTFTTTPAARKTYFMTPYIVKNNVFVIESDITTYGGSQPYWNWSAYSHGAANYRQELLASLSQFPALEAVLYSVPQVPEVISMAAIKDAIHATNVRLQEQNLFDGAELLKGSISVAPDLLNPGWFLCFAPYRGPLQVDVLAGQIAQG